MSESLQCSQQGQQGISSETVVSNPYSFDDYLMALAERNGIKELLPSQYSPTSFSLPPQHHHLYMNLNPFKYAVQESDFFKVNKREDEEREMKQLHRQEKTTKARAEEVGAGGFELSLSLPLQQQYPSSNRSNNASSTSEISEAISSYSMSAASYKDCSISSSAKRSLNLDLSIALCGN